MSSSDDRQYRLGSVQEDGRAREDVVKEKEDDSLLVFEFLKRKRAMPSPRRLDYMLYVLSPFLTRLMR
jgi:hypothetical protein